jgi:hypothetical protein
MQAHTTTATIQPPAHWVAWDQRPHRACVLCTNGTGPDDARLCGHAAARSRGKPVPCAQARSNHGACGPEAQLMSYPGIA